MLRPTVLHCIGFCSLNSSKHATYRRLARICSLPQTSNSSSSSRQHSTVACSADMAVDVTRENFQKLLPAIREALDKCKCGRPRSSISLCSWCAAYAKLKLSAHTYTGTFYSFDCEMTGLFTGEGYANTSCMPCLSCPCTVCYGVVTGAICVRDSLQHAEHLVVC
jgi:hypothetical protein